MAKQNSNNRPLNPSSTCVVLLAAGHGKRMRPLTDTLPKPLLKVGSRALIEHHIDRLQSLGFRELIINTAYLGEKIKQHLGTGRRYGVNIKFSDESETGALETAGGIKKSLPLISSEWFLVVNSDIYTDFDFTSLLGLHSPQQGCLVMVRNPNHNPCGDFTLNDQGQFDLNGSATMTFAGIGLYRKEMFSELPEGKLALGPILREKIQNLEVDAVPYFGEWTDVGTPERLAELNQRVLQLR